MEPSVLSAIISEYGRTTDVSISSWSIPYGGLQTDFIVWKYKILFPGQILADRMKVRPKALAESLHVDFPSIDMDKVRAAAAQHEKEKQIILDGMKNLIIQKTVLAMDPLTKLELYEDLKFRMFQQDMQALWGQKKWDPMQQKYVEPAATYATSGCLSKDYKTAKKTKI